MKENQIRKDIKIVFFYDGIKAWNIVITSFPNIPSFNILKNHTLSLIRPIKKTIFKIHDPVGLRYLFYLRVGLSPLRCHKNNHGFIDKYNLVNLINRYQIYLYGERSIDYNDNKIIILSTIKFIKETGRFIS